MVQPEEITTPEGEIAHKPTQEDGAQPPSMLDRLTAMTPTIARSGLRAGARMFGGLQTPKAQAPVSPPVQASNRLSIS